MLQRTKAEQVAPVYEQFVMKYPNPLSLSKTSLSALKEDIVALGLEKRAKGLKKLSIQLVDGYQSNIPNNKKEFEMTIEITQNAKECFMYMFEVKITVEAII